MLTMSESMESLKPLAGDLVNRSRLPRQQPPAVLYTNRDHCRVGGGGSRLQDLFGDWPQLVVSTPVVLYIICKCHLECRVR